LQVIATGPLSGCAGADPGDLRNEAPSGGSAGNPSVTAGSASGGSAGAASGGSSSAGSGTPDNPFSNAGTSSGGAGHFGEAGSANGGSSASGGNSASGGSASGLAGAGGSSNPGELVAKVSDIAVGSFQIVGGLFFMGRDAGGIWAMSMQCTHKFCAVVIAGNELDCPCHHSRFDRAGNVLQGPATERLPFYRVYVDASGNISVDKYTVVSPNTRAPV
jgi:nitrite reductase/ring-hydroxylating ferredoxin subunit